LVPAAVIDTAAPLAGITVRLPNRLAIESADASPAWVAAVAAELATTVIGAITARGVTTLMTVEGGTSGAVSLRFVHEYICQTLRRDEVVVMDYLGAHHATGVRVAIASWVAPVPPCSSELTHRVVLVEPQVRPAHARSRHAGHPACEPRVRGHRHYPKRGAGVVPPLRV
jgi:hypothetical protein